MSNILAYAFETPTANGRIRTVPEDFWVREELGFNPSGNGEHVFLKVRKRAVNTDWVARQLADFAGVKHRTVSYAGLKDRQGIAEQWFSVHLPGKSDVDWAAVKNDQFTVLAHHRHHRKLRRGALKGNHFWIVVRDIDVSPDHLEERRQRIIAEGVPNYFGEQRFGHQGNNLVTAEAMFLGEKSVKSRHLRGLYLSAARAEIFNRVLSRRVMDKTWNRALPGDVMMLEGSHSYFCPQTIDDTINCRVQQMDLHPTGPLWGSGDLPSQDRVRFLEQDTAHHYRNLKRGLERAGLAQERRALRLTVTDFHLEALSETATALTFHLPRGSYATTVLRELFAVNYGA